MAHIHTKSGQHDHTASAFIIRIDGSSPRVLVHLHKRLKQYIQVGGHVELNETPWQTIAHELREESGYDLSQLKLLQPEHRLLAMSNVVQHPMPVSNMTHPFGGIDHFHTDGGYLFITDQAPAHSPDEGESKDLRFLTRKELVAEDNIPANVRETYLFALDTALEHWQPVPTDTFSLE